VAAKLDHEVVRAEAVTLRHRLAVALGVLQPGGRVGREVRVLLENLGWSGIFANLNQEALIADHRLKRHVGLRAVDLVARTEVLAKGRHAEVDDDVLQLRATHAAGAANAATQRYV